MFLVLLSQNGYLYLLALSFSSPPSPVIFIFIFKLPSSYPHVFFLSYLISFSPSLSLFANKVISL